MKTLSTKKPMCVKFAALTIAAGAMLATFADTSITENVTLDADADWCDQGQVTIASGVTINRGICK